MTRRPARSSLRRRRKRRRGYEGETRQDAWDGSLLPYIDILFPGRCVAFGWLFWTVSVDW